MKRNDQPLLPHDRNAVIPAGDVPTAAEEYAAHYLRSTLNYRDEKGLRGWQKAKVLPEDERQEQ